jgi:hypothetical protein
MDRRTFLQSALLAGTPVLRVVPPFLFTHSATSNAEQPSSSPPAEIDADLASVVFAIEGWDRIASGDSGEHRATDQVFITINRSWRCAWR